MKFKSLLFILTGVGTPPKVLLTEEEMIIPLFLNDQCCKGDLLLRE